MGVAEVENRQRLSLYHYAIVALLIASGIFFLFVFIRQPVNEDIDFCRMIWEGMQRGNQRVIKYIDWEHLKLFGQDIGSHYGLARTDEERAKYQQSFLKGVSLGLRQNRRQAIVFKNWRNYYRDGQNSIVAVDIRRPDRTLVLLFTLVKEADGKKLIAVDWGR
ncbi:MAG: hypothetical protein NC923_04495 [Candidatus Omnitrophica bacterium]|nr:hypothetical protein [Candidatus Omnitrophota bacterium]